MEAAVGWTIDHYVAIGGGAQSPLWRQILADVLGAEITTLAVSEGPPANHSKQCAGMTDRDQWSAPAFGAALLSGVGTGAWSSVPEATDACLREATREAPEPARATVYRDGHAVYRELYTRLAPLFPREA